MPIAYSYLRFSSPEQASGDSLRRQLADSEAYAREHGLVLDTSLRDEGVSGFRGANRDDDAALGRFLTLVREGRVPEGSYLLVESLDRLSRQAISQALATLQALLGAGVVVVTLSDRKRYDRESMDDLMSLMWALMQMSRAHEESALKSRRVTAAWSAKHARAAETKAPITSRCPAWLRLEGSVRHGNAVYHVVEERAAVVREIFSLAIDGMGSDSIAATLNAREEPTWGEGKRKGRHWHDSYVYKILTSRAVFGEYERPGKPAIPDYFPAVVDQETFFRARAAAADRRSSGPTARGAPGSYKNVFSGVAKCGKCDGGMHYLEKGKRSSGPVLMCGAARLRKCSNRRTYDYDRLETLIVGGLPQAMSDAERRAAAGQTSVAARADAAVVAARAKVVDVEKRLALAVETAEAGAGAAMAPRIVALTGALEEAKAAVSEAEIAARAASEASRMADLGVLIRKLREGPSARPAVAAIIRRVIVGMRCDDAGNVRFATVNGGSGGGRVRAHADPKPNPGQFVDGVRRRGRVASNSSDPLNASLAET